MDQLEAKFDIVWDEELMITSSRDIEDIISESPVEWDKIIPYYDANDEDWVNPFALTFDDEVRQDVGPLAIIDDCHV